MMPERMVDGQRLRSEHVECRAREVARIEERDQVRVDDEVAARDVDDVGA